MEMNFFSYEVKKTLSLSFPKSTCYEKDTAVPVVASLVAMGSG
jgi:hypothetical protein